MSGVPFSSRNKGGKGVWATLWAPLPFEESAQALKAAGTAGFAIYCAICKQRFLTAPEHRGAFFCSEENISFHCGISPRRLREPLRKLEAAGVVRIQRPQGAEKLNHQANKLTLIPFLTDGNKIESAGRDVTSGPVQTTQPAQDGQKAIAVMSVNAESPLTGGDSFTGLDTALGSAVPAVNEKSDSRPDSKSKSSTNLLHVAKDAFKATPLIRYSVLAQVLVSKGKVSTATAKRFISDMRSSGDFAANEVGLLSLGGGRRQSEPPNRQPKARTSLEPMQSPMPVLKAYKPDPRPATVTTVATAQKPDASSPEPTPSNVAPVLTLTSEQLASRIQAWNKAHPDRQRNPDGSLRAVIGSTGQSAA